MLDDFRQQADTSRFDEDTPSYDELPPMTKRELLGMTPAQRFIIAFLLLFLVVVLSSFCLLVTGKVVLPL